MPDILYLVNSISSTSIPIEIGNAINQHTDSNVTIGAFFESAGMTLDPDIQKMDLPTEFFGGSGNFDLKAYRRLWSHLNNHDYDIIHTHHNFTGAVGRIIGKLRDTPVINTEHNDLAHFSLPQRMVNAATFGFPKVNVYNSHCTQSSLGPVERWLSSRGEVIYNGIDIDRVAASHDYPLPVELPEGILVTNVGVMTEQKNQTAILKAAKKIKGEPEAESVHFLIAGSGPLEDKLRKKAVRLGVNDIVTFTGYLPRREHIYSLFHQSDIFLVPSVYEGFCVAAVEAMACKLPVIASDIEVLHEVIGDDGIYVPNRDVQRLAEKIVQTIPEIDTESMGKRRDALHHRAVTRFPLKRTAVAYHELYLDACN
ncbi:glycosyltransferase family 4 protein [Haladaptatus sp. DJG-WS-42]|uniref:glycosyltransferase family 4 protein n=1 Tax=Haladaptatus sp. DJG-WS-42 TaxID=3120516 RepID=UPI0030D5613D